VKALASRLGAAESRLEAIEKQGNVSPLQEQVKVLAPRIDEFQRQHERHAETSEATVKRLADVELQLAELARKAEFSSPQVQTSRLLGHIDDLCGNGALHGGVAPSPGGDFVGNGYDGNQVRLRNLQRRLGAN